MRIGHRWVHRGWVIAAVLSGPGSVVSEGRPEGDEAVPTLEGAGWIGAPAELTSFEPLSVAVDFQGKLLVLDGARKRIVTFSADGGYLGQYGQAGVEGFGPADPTNLTTFRGFQALVADPGRGEVVRYDRYGRLLPGFHLADPSGEAFIPWGIAVGDDGNIYLTDPVSGRILVLNPGGAVDRVIGDIDSDGGRFVSPRGIAVSRGRIFLTDAAGDRVIVLNRWGRLSAAWGGTGGAEGQFLDPWGLALDGSDRVWVVDSGNRRIQVFTAGGEHLAVFCAGGSERFEKPGDIAISPENCIFVADSGRRALFRARIR